MPFVTCRLHLYITLGSCLHCWPCRLYTSHGLATHAPSQPRLPRLQGTFAFLESKIGLRGSKQSTNEIITHFQSSYCCEFMQRVFYSTTWDKAKRLNSFKAQEKLIISQLSSSPLPRPLNNHNCQSFVMPPQTTQRMVISALFHTNGSISALCPDIMVL